VKYKNTISGEITSYPYRFKKRNEFYNEYGEDWKVYVGWNTFDEGMNYLFGKNFEYSVDTNIIDNEFSENNNMYNGLSYLRIPNSEWSATERMLTLNTKILDIYNYMDTKLVYENTVIRFSNF